MAEPASTSTSLTATEHPQNGTIKPALKTINTSLAAPAQSKAAQPLPTPTAMETILSGGDLLHQHHVSQMLCQGEETVTTRLAASPHSSPGVISRQLYPKPWAWKRLILRFLIKRDLWSKRGNRHPSQEEMDRARTSGRWGPKDPSDLFLKIYSDVLLCIHRDPLVGLTSPPLLGTSGTIPLTVLSVIPDIMAHYASCIVRAEREVILATNYWQPSNSVTTVCDALRELSKRVGEEISRGVRKEGDKIVVKVMYDRGTLKQLWTNHAPVKEKDWHKVDLPEKEEIPNLEMEVVNFHRPLLGTFHAKFLIVDRKMACLNSNNIQDRPNLEMMVHLEGAIVDSLYDAFLISWFNPLRPPLPCLLSPPHPTSISDFKFGSENLYLEDIDIEDSKTKAREMLKRDGENDDAPQKLAKAYGTTPTSPNGPAPGGGIGAVAKTPVGDDGTPQRPPAIPLVPQDTPKADGAIDASHLTAPPDAHQTGHANEASSSAVSSRSDDTPAGAGVGVRSIGHSRNGSRSGGHSRTVSETLNAGALTKAVAAVPLSTLEDFEPHIIHAKHEPVPIALVCRKPHGFPGHQDMRVPQDAAWLAALRYARRNVFIQSPTVNAKPVVDGIVDACRRGVQVTIFADLGFNDKGESIPFQGGTNQEVVIKLFKELKKTKHHGNLHVFWYTGKDQLRPMNAIKKSRNCHVKFMTIDDEIGIVGNGNQDTQSWFHSCEINIMVDSKEVVAEWLAAIKTNQNTHLYGKVDDDGIWRENGKTMEELYPGSYDPPGKPSKKTQRMLAEADGKEGEVKEKGPQPQTP